MQPPPDRKIVLDVIKICFHRFVYHPATVSVERSCDIWSNFLFFFFPNFVNKLRIRINKCVIRPSLYKIHHAHTAYPSVRYTARDTHNNSGLRGIEYSLWLLIAKFCYFLSQTQKPNHLTNIKWDYNHWTKFNNKHTKSWLCFCGLLNELNEKVSSFF